VVNLRRKTSELWPILKAIWVQPKFFEALASEMECLPDSAAQVAASGALTVTCRWSFCRLAMPAGFRHSGQNCTPDAQGIFLTVWLLIAYHQHEHDNSLSCLCCVTDWQQESRGPIRFAVGLSENASAATPEVG
jgi:hypothetical protein